MKVELLVAPDCPHANVARSVLRSCIEQFGVTVQVHELVGDYPSPTILVDGIDAMTGTVGLPHGQACRLDIPTPLRVLAALRAASTAPLDGTRTDR